MPKLLAAFSVGKKEDIKANTVPYVELLDQWFQQRKNVGVFYKYGKDVLGGFESCSPKQKLVSLIFAQV